MSMSNAFERYEHALQAHLSAKQEYQRACVPLLERAISLGAKHREVLEPLYDELSQLSPLEESWCYPELFGEGAGYKLYKAHFSLDKGENCVLVAGERYAGCNEYEYAWFKVPMEYFCEQGEALIEAEALRLKDLLAQRLAQAQEAHLSAEEAQEREELARLKAKYEA